MENDNLTGILSLSLEEVSTIYKDLRDKVIESNQQQCCLCLTSKLYILVSSFISLLSWN